MLRCQLCGGRYIIIRHRSNRCPAHRVLLSGDSYKRVSRQIAEGPGGRALSAGPRRCSEL
jgi:hypothetical protein